MEIQQYFSSMKKQMKPFLVFPNGIVKVLQFYFAKIKMTQRNALNVKLYTSQFNKLKSGVKNGSGVILTLSSNVLGNSNDEANFPHKLLLTNTQVFRLRKAFVLNPSANMKLSKTQFHKIGQAGGFLGRLLRPILKTGLPLLNYVRKP